MATNHTNEASCSQSKNISRVTFEMNGRGYETDAETLDVLRGIVPAAKASGDMSAVIAVMELGQTGGRIRKMAP